MPMATLSIITTLAITTNHHLIDTLAIKKTTVAGSGLDHCELDSHFLGHHPHSYFRSFDSYILTLSLL